MIRSKIAGVAVIGAGTIGLSWAAYFLARGCDVYVYDPIRDADSIRRDVRSFWPLLGELGLWEGASLERLNVAPELNLAAQVADFIQECGPENEGLKIDIFARLDAAAPEDVVIASSSSGLLMSRIQSACRYPQRCVIGHPFNPPHLMPLVEVVAGDLTDAETVDAAMRFYKQIGKRPIHVKREMRGHVANRLQAALWREAVNLVASGVASVADVDAAVSDGPGLRWALMGPSLTFHLGGGEGGMQHFLDHLGGAVQDWWDDLGTPTLAPAVRQMLVNGVAAAAAGRSIAELSHERDRFLVDVLRKRGIEM